MEVNSEIYSTVIVVIITTVIEIVTIIIKIIIIFTYLLCLHCITKQGIDLNSEARRQQPRAFQGRLPNVYIYIYIYICLIF